MPESFALLFPILILVPGLLIPLLIITRMRALAANETSASGERVFARVAVVAMVALMVLSLYAAWEVFTRLSVLSGAGFAP